MTKKIHSYDKVVYLLQGGGALGSYQVGVCEELLKFGFSPDWVVGTSIGAINAAIIVGNTPEQRIPKLKAFWHKISSPYPLFIPPSDNQAVRESINFFSSQWVAMLGVPGFFKPRLFYPWLFYSMTPDHISFYDTSELRETLLELIDFDLINKKQTRLTLGAVNVTTGEDVLFDNYHQTLGPEHVMASGALPPGFPAIKIENDYYWDGGISSNTPFKVILEEKSPTKLLCFIVNLFSHLEHFPTSMLDVMKARKEIEYSSRHREILNYFCELHFFQKTIKELSKTVKNNDILNAALKKISHIGLPLELNIARFHYTDRPSDLWSKDYNFSHFALRQHLHSGCYSAQKALKDLSWLEDNHTKDYSGAVMHEF